MATASAALHRLSAISLFVEDLAAAKAFYTSVFGVNVVFEDEVSAAVKFENLIVNLLKVSEAGTLVAPRPVGSPDGGKRFQLSIWVDDLDTVSKNLADKKIQLLTGPQTQPWGMRTLTFEDPAGNNWEVGQQLKG